MTKVFRGEKGWAGEAATWSPAETGSGWPPAGPGFLDYRLLGKQRRKDGPASSAVPALPMRPEQQWEGDLTTAARGAEATRNGEAARSKSGHIRAKENGNILRLYSSSLGLFIGLLRSL